MRRITAFLVALLLAVMPFMTANAATSSKSRDFVLVLDDSGSMNGEPCRQLVYAAQETVRSIFAQSDNARIAVIKYSDWPTVLSGFRTKQYEDELIYAISGLYGDGMTYMNSALSKAQELIDGSNATERVVIFMSDGMPSDDVNKIFATAKTLHRSATVYTIGFFQYMDASSIRAAEEVLRGIASDKTKFYDVEDAYDFQIAFEDIVDEVILDYKRIIVYIECPVDVQITHQGETLSKYNTRTSFGALQFEGADNEKKLLRLDPKNNYTIDLTGTGTGTMNYTISYPDSNGNYTDSREFKYVSITNRMRITSSTAKTKSTSLAIDTNGDGKTDQTLTASPGSPYRGTPPSISSGVSFTVYESSYVINNNPVVDGAKANDGNYNTAWNARNSRSGVGEWIEFAVRDGNEYTFNGFDFYNGYNKFKNNNDYWQLNARVKRISVYCDGVFVQSFDVRDTRAGQSFNFTNPPAGGSIKIEIDEVYYGDKYKDVCISEIEFY